MPKKILVTKEFHKEALRAIAITKTMGSDEKIIDLIRQAFISYLETQMKEEDVIKFHDYCEEFMEEFKPR